MSLITSKGGKRIYLCPNCTSGNIHKCLMGLQNSFWCLDCRHWGPWALRIKVSPSEAAYIMANKLQTAR